MSDIRRSVQQQFGSHAQRYVTSADHAAGASLDQLLATVRPQPGWRALDVATGGGHTALALAPRVRQVVASDLTFPMLVAARTFITGRGLDNVRFLGAEAAALPFGDGTFDLITCRVAAHHFPDCAAFIREMARVLRGPRPASGGAGGVAALIDNVVPEDPAAADSINAFEKLRDPSHHRAHSRSDWLGFFAASGLTVLHAELFRKARDFDFWTSMIGVAAETKAQLRAMLEQAPTPALEALTPEYSAQGVKFYLSEILVVAQKLD